MRTLKLTVAYDGTRFVGWQRQAHGESIQARLEAALTPIAGNRAVRVVGAGRTDAGVHAAGQVASCPIACRLDVGDIRRALNARLPPDIRVREVEDAPSGFHARFWAHAKTYAYHLLDAAVADPIARHVVWHVPSRLDTAAMDAALAAVRGRHDFRAFQAAGTRVSTTERTLQAAALTVEPWQGFPHRASRAEGDRPPGEVLGPTSTEGRIVVLQFTGDGFLRHMVRNLVGTLVEIGLGRRPHADLSRILAGRDRRMAGPTAPPQGLTLVSVDYGDGPPAGGREARGRGEATETSSS